MKTNVYVDAFNLYFGAVKETEFRWLDVDALCRLALPQHCEINRIRYFTAMVQSRADDPQKDQRQLTYLRALKTIPHLSIHYGRYLTKTARARLANPPKIGSRSVKVLRTEEKGSDVNLATYLLIDAFMKNYEMARVLSNDSDLVFPIEVTQKVLDLQVGVLNPHSKTPSWALIKAVPKHHYRKLRKSALSKCQFPDTMQDEQGKFHEPDSW